MRTNVPEQLTDLDLDALTALEGELVAEFDEQYDGEKDVAVMKDVAEALRAVRAEVAAKHEQAAAEAAELDALRGEVHASDDEPGDDDGDEDEGDDDGDDADATNEPADDEGDEGEDENAGEPADDKEREPVTASGKRQKRRSGAPSARGVRRTGAGAPPAGPAGGDDEARVVITAAADVPGYANSQELDKVALATAMHARARGLADRSPRANVATVSFGLPRELVVDPKNGVDVHQAIEAAMAVSRAQGGQNGAEALVAAGGWCTPSQTMFDLFRIDSRDGIFTLPTIGITRGGIEIPSFLTVGDAAGALWTWTEDTDANNVWSVATVARASNVATIETTEDHNLAVGQTVRVEGAGQGFDGTWTVASTPAANSFTYANTGANVTEEAGTGTVTVVKGCMRIPCPTWTDYRLENEGLCVTHGNLQDASYPEMTTEFLDLVVTAHLHRVGNAAFAKVLATADSVTVTAIPSDAAGEVLNAIELQVQAYRNRYLMARTAVLEATFPMWALGLLRAVMAIRNGVSRMDVSDAEIIGWFTTRGVRPQFIYGYQDLGDNVQAWPGTMDFLLHVAGAYIKGEGPSLDLGVVRDSRLNSENDFTAGWSEQSYLVGQRGPDALEVTVTVPDTGVTGGQIAA